MHLKQNQMHQFYLALAALKFVLGGFDIILCGQPSQLNSLHRDFANL